MNDVPAISTVSVANKNKTLVALCQQLVNDGHEVTAICDDPIERALPMQVKPCYVFPPNFNRFPKSTMSSRPFAALAVTAT